MILNCVSYESAPGRFPCIFRRQDLGGILLQSSLRSFNDAAQLGLSTHENKRGHQLHIVSFAQGLVEPDVFQDFLGFLVTAAAHREHGQLQMRVGGFLQNLPETRNFALGIVAPGAQHTDDADVFLDGSQSDDVFGAWFISCKFFIPAGQQAGKIGLNQFAQQLGTAFSFMDPHAGPAG
jgi:hypothetical protein